MTDALDEERRTMTRWAEAFAAVNGWPPRLDDLGDDGTFTCTFEPRFEPIAMLGTTRHFAGRPKLVAHLERMGFRWGNEGRVLTAPSPETFNLLADRLLPGAGFRVGSFVRDRRTPPAGPRLSMFLAGRIPVHFATPRFYDMVVAIRPAHKAAGGGADHFRFHFQSLAHDLTVLALNYQLVPRAAIEAFADRITAALPDRVAGWALADAPAPVALTAFFDNDLNRFCYAAWSRCNEPADFAPIVAENLPQLLACLDARIDEARRSLDADAPPAPPPPAWEFDLKVRGPAARPASPSAPVAHVAFRDPPTPEEEGRALRLKIAHALVRAPQLPVDLPAFGLRLLDVTADARGVALQFGAEQPVAAIQLSRARTNASDPVPLRRPGDPRPAAVDVAVEALHDDARRHEHELGVMADRLRRAITTERWEEAHGHARALRALPVGVPMDHFRQLVPGLQHPSGLIRTGFRCNQDCGLCWQSREWGGYDSSNVLRWIEDLALAGASALILSGGEPTLDPHLERYLRHAREHGMASITLETNAIQCARNDLAARLRDAGLTVAFVSLHSGDAAVSDAITRAPGTHARTVRGVHALLEAGVTVKLNAVMTQEGIDHLAALPDFIHQEFGRHGDLLQGLMLSYPTSPFDQALVPAIVPEPRKLRRVLREALERCFALGLIPEGLDGPCGPPLCAFGADPRVTALLPITETLPFRQYLPECDGCAVRDACFGCRIADVALYGSDCAVPLRERPDAHPDIQTPGPLDA